MSVLQTAINTIDKALASKEIGTTVAVRFVASLTADHGPLENFTATGLYQISRWFQSKPDRVHVLGNVKSGHLCVMARFENGGTGLVTASTSGVGTPQLEIVLTGNHGLLSWEANDIIEPLVEKAGEQKLDAGAADLLKQIRQSVDAKAPVVGGKVHSRRSSLATGATVATIQPAAPTKPPFGLLLVSGDHTHQPGYAQELLNDKRCKPIGLVDEAEVDPDRKKLNEQLAKRMGIPVLPNLQEALARKDVQVVSICAEPRRRGRIILAAAKARKHLYLDKPFTISVKEAELIEQQVAKSQVVAHMFSQVRSDVAVRIRKAIESKELGTLLGFHTDLTFAKGPAGAAQLGKPRVESQPPKIFEVMDSKRELTNIGVYPLVLLLWLLNKRVRNLYATTGNYFFAEHQKNDMEDFGQILMQLDGELTASISVGRTGWYSHPGGSHNRTYLVGSKRTLIIDAHRPRVEIWSDSPAWSPPGRNPTDPMGMWDTPPGSPYKTTPRNDWFAPPATVVSDFTYFLDCVEKGRQSDVSVSIAADTSEILLAAYQSAATGDVVELKR